MARSSRAAARILSRALSERALETVLSEPGTVRRTDARRDEDRKRFSQNGWQAGGFIGFQSSRSVAAGGYGRFSIAELSGLSVSLLVGLLFIIFAWPAIAEDDVESGRALLQKNCASCHAIGSSGESPHKLAPPFRTLGKRYPIESLEEALGEGIMSGHPDMPEFKFAAEDVGDIIAYLKSIQQH
jgi:cytochrome c